ELRRDGTTIVKYQLSDGDRRRLLRATSLAAEVLFAAGAEEVYPALRHRAVLRDVGDAAALREADLSELDVELVAHHPMGTARMADDRTRGVTGASGAVHELQDLYVVD